jgi:hypothetical protein
MNEDTAKLAADGTLAASAEPHISTPASEPAFPAEAFPCPHCGQMLGPGVRVCASCRHTIDPAQIRLPALQAPADAGAAATAPRAAAQPKNTPFPWVILLALVLGMLVLSGVAENRFGITPTIRFFSLVPPATALWVIFDALRKRVPRPLQWGVGTMLLWPVVFPWYLARRRQLDTVCPFVESGARALVRIVVLWLLINALALLFLGSVLKSLPK